MESLKGRLKDIVAKLTPEVINIRHQLHACPELGGKEYKTSKLIKEKLISLGIKVSAPFIETDVIGFLDGNQSHDEPCITLRADIDALPINEETGLSYSSRNHNVMHACGHDGHTAILLGTAMVLSELQEFVHGKVRFVFQPGEEIMAMGKDLVDAGALDTPPTDGVFAIHSNSSLPTGTIGLRSGPIMAAADFFEIEIRGKGGHASSPEYCIDPILTAAKVVEGLQSIASRSIDPQSPVVVSICHISSGQNANIIPEKAFMEGTVRYLDKLLGCKIPAMMERIISGICSSMGTQYRFAYDKKYIPAENSENIVPFVECVIKQYLGESKFKLLPKASMGGEDFSFYLKKYPGVFAFVGMGEDYVSLHNPKFDFNDDAIESGITYFSALAIEFLNNKSREKKQINNI